MSANLKNFIKTKETSPLFLQGEARDQLSKLPDELVDCCITSPPYWGKRDYNVDGIGLEKKLEDFIENLSLVFAELKRVLKSDGSFWLNIGDGYRNGKLLGVPWRVAFKLMDEQGWVLKNSVIWNKVKGGLDNSKNRLGNNHEMLFHFTKKPSGYFYDVDSIRSNPSKSKVVNGKIVSATGVSGVRYKRQIELSTVLTPKQKIDAYEALEDMLQLVRDGKLADFRMIIKGQQRTTHSDSTKLSGRAKELSHKGFYFLKYHPKGSKPNDVWNILPEDTQNRKLHYAPFPEDLCRIPILSTCPPEGIVLDPFCGTGTAMLVAQELGRRSIGIDLSKDYLTICKSRVSRPMENQLLL